MRQSNRKGADENSSQSQTSEKDNKHLRRIHKAILIYMKSTSIHYIRQSKSRNLPLKANEIKIKSNWKFCLSRCRFKFDSQIGFDLNANLARFLRFKVLNNIFQEIIQQNAQLQLSLKEFLCEIFRFEWICNCKRETNDFHVQKFSCFSNFSFKLMLRCIGIHERGKNIFPWKDFLLLVFMIFHSNFLLIEWKYEVSHLLSIFFQ